MGSKVVTISIEIVGIKSALKKIKHMENEIANIVVSKANANQALYELEQDLFTFVAMHETKAGEPERITGRGILTIIAIAKALILALPELRKLYTSRKTGEFKRPKWYQFGAVVKIIGMLLFTFVKERLKLKI